MKKYVSPELNVELFNVVDDIMVESAANAIDFPGGTPTINDNEGDEFGGQGF